VISFISFLLAGPVAGLNLKVVQTSGLAALTCCRAAF